MGITFFDSLQLCQILTSFNNFCAVNLTVDMTPRLPVSTHCFKVTKIFSNDHFPFCSNYSVLKYTNACLRVYFFTTAYTKCIY